MSDDAPDVDDLISAQPTLPQTSGGDVEDQITPTSPFGTPQAAKKAAVASNPPEPSSLYTYSAGALGTRSVGQPTGVLDADQMARAFTYGLSDKAGALGSGVGAALRGDSFSDAYNNQLAKSRQQAEQYASEHPYANVLSKFGLGAAGLTASPAAVAGMAARPIAYGVGIGAGTGAASGLAEANDQTPLVGYGPLQAPLGDVTGALSGAAIGAGLGAAVPWAIGNIAPVVRKIIGGNAPDQLTDQATNLIAQKIAQDAQSRGGQSAADMADAIAAWNQAGVPAGISDVGGHSTQGLAGGLYRTTTGTAGSTRFNYLNSRDSGATTRLLDTIDQAAGTNTSAYNATEDLIRQRSQDASPLYDALYERHPVVSSNYISYLLGEPLMQEGLAAGVKLQRLEALAQRRPFDPQSYTLTFNAAGDPQWMGTPNLRTLDAAKRGLDDMLSRDTYRDTNTGRLTQMGRQIDAVRREFVGEMDDLTGGPNGAYASARAAWAGPSRAMEMIRNGQSWMSYHPDELRDMVGQLNPTERQFFTLGVADNMRTRVLSNPGAGDEAKRLLNSPYTRQQAAAIFDPSTYNDLATRIAGERMLFGTKATETAGTQTAERLAQNQSLHPHGVPGTASALYLPAIAMTAEHHPEVAAGLGIFRGLQGLRNWARTASPATLDRASDLMSGTPQEQEQVLRGIAGSRPLGNNLATSFVLPGLGSMAGGMYPNAIRGRPINAGVQP